MQQFNDRPELMPYVRALEGRNNQTRGNEVLKALELLGIVPAIQECYRPRIRNIIVDFQPGADVNLPVFCAHYDAVKGSPGAADNASGVAVLLGLCREMPRKGVPLRIIFFDREEAWLRTPLLRLGLLGSWYYARRVDLKRVTAVYNLESCGTGDSLALWPVRRRGKPLPAVVMVTKAAQQLDMHILTAHVPWYLLSSDHQSFRWCGLENAISLSMFPAREEPVFTSILGSGGLGRMLRDRSGLPEPLCSIHTAADTSDRLSEGSLQAVLSLLIKVLEGP